MVLRRKEKSAASGGPGKRGDQLAVQGEDGVLAGMGLAEVQLHLARTAEEPGQEEDQLLDHGLHASTLTGMTMLEHGLALDAEHAQQIERQTSELEHELVRLVLSARKPLHIELSLQLSVELLAGSVIFVESGNHRC